MMSIYEKSMPYFSLNCIKHIYDMPTVVTFLLLDRCSSIQFGRRKNHKNINLKGFSVHFSQNNTKYNCNEHKKYYLKSALMFFYFEKTLNYVERSYHFE